MREEELTDPEAKGQLERQHDFLEKNFEPRRRFANHLDFQDQLDGWSEKANGRQHRTIRQVPADRLAEERLLQPLGDVAVDTDTRWVLRVPQQPLIRVDRNDYSVAPAFAGRRIEVRVSQSEITATVHGSGELAAGDRLLDARSPPGFLPTAISSSETGPGLETHVF